MPTLADLRALAHAARERGAGEPLALLHSPECRSPDRTDVAGFCCRGVHDFWRDFAPDPEALQAAAVRRLCGRPPSAPR